MNKKALAILAVLAIATALAIGVYWLNSSGGSNRPLTIDSGGDVPAPTAAPTQPAPATRPPKQPKTWTIPILVSPAMPAAATSRAADPAAAELIEKHNAWVRSLPDLMLRGGCVWTSNGKSDGAKPRPMSILWTAGPMRAAVSCANDTCVFDAKEVVTSPGSAMQVDAMYLLMFRTFDPAQFKPEAGGEGVTTVRSSAETLVFSGGRLVDATFETPRGPVTIHLGDLIALPSDPAIKVPATVEVEITDDPPFKRGDKPLIVFTLDPAQSGRAPSPAGPPAK